MFELTLGGNMTIIRGVPNIIMTYLFVRIHHQKLNNMRSICYTMLRFITHLISIPFSPSFVLSLLSIPILTIPFLCIYCYSSQKDIHQELNKTILTCPKEIDKVKKNSLSKMSRESILNSTCLLCHADSEVK